LSSKFNDKSFAEFVNALDEMAEPEGVGSTAHTSSVSVRDWEAIRAASNATDNTGRE